MHLPLSLSDAIEDPVIQGVPLLVLLRCWKWLEPHRHRPLSAQDVGRDLRIKPRNATAALRLLVENGYLERGQNAEHGVATFRLLVTRFVRAA